MSVGATVSSGAPVRFWRESAPGPVHTRFENIGVLLTMAPRDGGGGGPDTGGRVEDAVVHVDREGRVVAVGPRASLADDGTARRRVDLGRAVVLPGFVESHTHIVFAGDRLPDFEARCGGASYEEIARRGGGIQTTVRATRAASESELLALALPRLEALVAAGATTVEVKSGYGLDTESELRMLRVIRALGEEHPVDVVATFLGAHTVPTAFGVTREDYVDQILRKEMLPEVARQGLADFCDVFCDEGAFTLAESRRVLEAAAERGLGLKIHAEQLVPTGGARLAAELGAVSADHLDRLPEADIATLAARGTVATLLPGATVYLGRTRHAPARALLDAGVTVALSTDCNPGSAWTTHLLLMGTLGCVQMGMAPVEALRALTWGGARALGRESFVGALRPGALADMVVLDVDRPADALYEMAGNPVAAVYKRGERVYARQGPARLRRGAPS